MRPRAAHALSCVLLAASAACSGPPANQRPRPVPRPSDTRTAASASPAAAASQAAPALPASAAPPPPAAEQTGEDPPPQADALSGTIEAPSPPAPCDFARFYRGAVDGAKVSLVLRRSGSALEGASAYDKGSGDLELRGAVDQDGRFSLRERKQGKDLSTFDGTCDAATGVLAGTWKQGGAEKAFSLRPREAGGVGLVERWRKIGQGGDTTPVCLFEIVSPAVFGLGDAQRTARINGLLRMGFGSSEATMEARVKTCPRDADSVVRGTYSIEANRHGLLSMIHDGYVYMGPAVHGDWHAGEALISIDVPSGRRLGLQDVVTSSKALRPVVKSCISFAGEKLDISDWELENFLQGVPAEEGMDSTIREPSFLVLDDGLAVVATGMPTVGAGFEFRGPVIRWGALLREGILKRSSPIARLWANEKPLEKEKPACQRIFYPSGTIMQRIGE